MNAGIDFGLEFRIYDSLLLKEGCLGFPLPPVTREKLDWLFSIWLFGSANLSGLPLEILAWGQTYPPQEVYNNNSIIIVAGAPSSA